MQISWKISCHRVPNKHSVELATLTEFKFHIFSWSLGNWSKHKLLLISWLDARPHCSAVVSFKSVRYVVFLQSSTQLSFLLKDFTELFGHFVIDSLVWNSTYLVAIATPWILSLSLGISVSILAWVNLIMQQKVLIIVIICLITPLLMTCFSSLVIWRSRNKKISTVRSFRQNQEARFSRTIFLITAASFITWMPFLYHNIAVRVWPDLIPWSAFFYQAPLIQWLICQLCYLHC